MQEDLQELIVRIIKSLSKGETDPRLDSYVDYKAKYTVLKPSVKVEVALTDGKVFKFDISDYFEGVIK